MLSLGICLLLGGKLSGLVISSLFGGELLGVCFVSGLKFSVDLPIFVIGLSSRGKLLNLGIALLVAGV